jgi:hypothetical protein
MNHWAFILGAYAVTLFGTFGLTAWSFVAMRAAEREAGALKGDR